MMRVRTIAMFKDKKTKTLREIGDEFECTEERYQEILNAGKFVEKLDEPEKSKRKKGDEPEPGEDDKTKEDKSKRLTKSKKTEKKEDL